MAEGSDHRRDGAAPESAQGLGGARADFVASLGRKVADARKSLAALDSDPRAQAPRDELRRKIHALGTSARMMRFDAMAQALAEAEAALETLDPADGTTLRNVTAVARALDDLPALAWSESRRPEPAGPAPAVPPSGPDSAESDSGAQAPMSVLVVGPEAIADKLHDAEDHRGIECERTEDAQHAIGLARAIDPDVVVLDAEVAQAAELVEALSDDPLTEPVPVVVVGKLPSDALARFVALGVARTLTAPYPGDALRAVCEARRSISAMGARCAFPGLGEPTIERRLSERLADEASSRRSRAQSTLSRAASAWRWVKAPR